MDAAGQTPIHNPSAVAAHVMAMRAAEGAGVPQSWEDALQHLQRSAEEGFAFAQAEIAALAGDWVLSDEIQAGRKLGKTELYKLRQNISISSWLAAPSKQIV